MEKGITRRELGLAAAATAAAVSVQAKPQASTTPSVSQPGLDPVQWTLANYDTAPLRLTFRATSREEAEIWQNELRAKLVELVGGFPQRVSLNPRIIETKQFAAYSRQKFTFESRPGSLVIGYLLTPTSHRAPHPVVVCVPGHGRGVDDIVGVDEHGNDRTEKPGYEHDFAIQVVEHGMAAVAIEPMAFGYRRDAVTMEKGPAVSACQPAAGSALLLGQTMIGWRVWDVMRTIDWIEARTELDATRVACMGISGGGTCTQFATALDLRIKAAFVSGYLNTFRDSIMSVSHCIDNYVPGILNWCENYDVACLIAPRFFFSEGGDHDPIFPVHATRAAFAKVKHVYEVFGVPERAQQQIFPGQHVFCGEQGLRFLAKSIA